MNKAVEFSNVDIIFGTRVKEAVSMLDAGKNRDEILSTTECVLGAAGVSLTVKPGEICVLMGLSGSGKSTLMRAVNGLNRVTRGAVMVAHEGAMVDVTKCNEDTLRQIRLKTVSMVFQSFALLPWRTVRDNAGFGLELRGLPIAERNRIVDETLELVGLDRWAHKFGHELSGGMQQRVGLARALATNPNILLMDEPFSALDPLIREKLQNELLDLQKRIQKTIIFVSHDLDEALKLGNQIAIMEGGRVSQCGVAEEILLNPKNDYVREFVKHMNPLNVLRGNSVMTPAANLRKQGNEVLIDKEGRIRLKLDKSGKPLGVTVDGVDGTLANSTDLEGKQNGMNAKSLEQVDLISAPVDLLLKSAISLRQGTKNPIILVDELGVLVGLCGDEEIFAGILGRPKTNYSDIPTTGNASLSKTIANTVTKTVKKTKSVAKYTTKMVGKALKKK